MQRLSYCQEMSIQCDITCSGKPAIYTLDVHPSYRRNGIGSKLLLALEEKLALLGAQAIRLEAALDKPGALELYRKAGYRERELVRNYYGRGNHAVRMWKNLDVCLCLTT